MSTGETVTRGGRTWKVFICDRCGERRLDFEVFGTGWPDAPREWCLFPDHRPGAS
jgi:hypothetical protein